MYMYVEILPRQFVIYCFEFLCTREETIESVLDGGANVVIVSLVCLLVGLGADF